MMPIEYSFYSVSMVRISARIDEVKLSKDVNFVSNKSNISRQGKGT